MNLLFSNNSVIDFNLFDIPPANSVKKSFKHLQYVDLEFKDWDNPFSNSSPRNLLLYYANLLNIDIPSNQDIFDQEYLNYLHEVYEKNYDGSDNWLNFHEQIHRCETFNSSDKNHFRLLIDYREKAGLLKKSFNNEWMQYSTTNVSSGDIYLSWSELAKPPYDYWKDGEPENIERMCELAKPWLHHRPRFSIALENNDFLENKKLSEFSEWWEKYERQWCDYWNIKHWNITDQSSVIVIGKVKNYSDIISLLKKNIVPKKVLLK